MGTARLPLAAIAWADHGGPARAESMSPLATGLLAGLRRPGSTPRSR